MSEMTLELARSIVAAAHKYNAWEGDISSLTDEMAVKDAPQMLQLARNAYAGAIRSDAVMEILFAAQVQSPDDNPTYYDEVYARHPEATKPGPAAAEPAASPSNAFAGAAAKEGNEGLDALDQQTQQVADAAKTVKIDDIFPGYDDMPKGKIVDLIMSSAKSGDLSEAEWEQIKDYETANEERSSILKLAPEFKPPAPVSAPPATTNADTSDYGSSEALVSAYETGSLGADRATQQGLFIPPKYDGESPVLPIDITSISDEELSRLTMRYHSLEAHTLWLVSQEEGRRDVAKGLGDDAWDDAYKHSFGRLKEAIEKETASALEAARSEAKHEANVNESVRTWRNRERRHSAEARSLKALSDGYDKAASRLSREQSRRAAMVASPTGK